MTTIGAIPSAPTRERVALLAFIGLLVAGGILYLYVGRNQWFFADDWAFLVARDFFSNPHVLLEPYNGHWMLLPTLFYGIWFKIFHLSSYLPYQVPVILLHLAIAALSRAVMRRAGVEPWTATLAAGALVLLGSSFENFLFAAQISNLGSVAFGLVQLLLATHSGPWNRRDWLAVVAGVMAILSSGTGVAMVIAVGIATLIVRGWRIAFLHTAPLAGVFIAWSLLFNPPQIHAGSVGQVVEFVAMGLDSGLQLLGQIPGAPVIIIVVLLLAAALAVIGARKRRSVVDWLKGDTVRRAGPALALLASTIVFLTITGIARAGPFGPESARAIRYASLVAMFIIPALACAVDLLRRHAPRWGWLWLLVLAMGIPGNLAALQNVSDRDDVIDDARSLILALPTLPGGDSAPDDMRALPESRYAPALTMGWLRAAIDRGWLTPNGDVSAEIAVIGTYHLALYQKTDGPVPSQCVDLDAPTTVHVARGDVLSLSGGFVQVVNRSPSASDVEVATYNPNRGNTIEILGDVTELELTSGGINGLGQLCG